MRNAKIAELKGSRQVQSVVVNPGALVVGLRSGLAWWKPAIGGRGMRRILLSAAFAALGREGVALVSPANSPQQQVAKIDELVKREPALDGGLSVDADARAVTVRLVGPVDGTSPEVERLKSSVRAIAEGLTVLRTFTPGVGGPE
jgi:hypothetical protein